ncbi:MAG: M23 family metallopeptidase [bacterium]
MSITLKLAKKSVLKLLFILAVISVCYVAARAGDVGAAYGVHPEIKQVKTADNPSVYYLDHERGMKKAYVSAKAFLSYGNKWSDVKIVSQDELDKWPDVKLIKSKQNNAVYYISGGQKFLIESEQQFIDAGFQWQDIAIISQADLNEYKDSNFKPAGAIGNYENNQLSIAIDPSSPKSDYFIMGSQDNLAAVFSLRADGKPVEIKRLVLNLSGVFNQDAIKEIYLTNESDIRYDVFAYPNNRIAEFNFNNQPIIVSPGEDRKIKVYANFNNISGDIINHALQISINAPENISGAKVSGNFPISGQAFKLAAAGDFLEKVFASEQSLNIKNNQAIIGSTEKNVGKFNIAETSGKSDVFVKELKFANKGNAGADSLSGFKLKNKAGQIIASVDKMSSSMKLVFKLDNYKIKKSSNETFTILADIIGGENSSVNLYLESAKIASSQGNFNLNANISNLDEIITIKRETVGVISKDLKANNKVFANQQGVIIGNFEIRNNNQKIQLSSLSFSLEKSAGMPDISETVYLADYNSGEIYGYFNGQKFNNGAVSVGLNGVDLKAKQNLTLSLITKISDSAINGGYYKIILNNAGYRAENGVLFSDAVNVAGEKLIAGKSNLYIYANNDLGEQSFTKGEKNIKIASFIIEAAAGSDIKITDISFSRGSENSGAASFENGFGNLRFYIGLSQIAVIKTPYGGDLSASGFKYVLRSGSRAEVKIYADTETDLKASEIQFAISNIAAVNNDSLIPAVIKNLNANSHKVVFGQASAEISKVADGFAAKGENDNIIAGFKVKNSGCEDLRLQSITINSADNELTYSFGYSNLKIVNRDTQRNAGYAVARPVAGANKINLNGFIVKAGEEAVFDVHVNADGIDSDGLSASRRIDIYFSDFEAKGKDSGVKAEISGDPTDNYNFAVSSAVDGIFIKPVSDRITYGFHDANYPYRASVGEHTGIDMAAAQGTKVKAAGNGTVIEVVQGSAYQTSYVSISHSAGLITRYAHLSRIDVAAGQQVKQGDTIGLSGGTPGTIGAGPYTNGAHLHFEVLENGIAVDPEKYL